MKLVSGRHYDKPPIIEATVEIQFEQVLGSNQIQAVLHDLSKKYPRAEEQFEVDIQLDANLPRVTEKRSQGYRLTSSDAESVVILRPTSVSITKLPPYQDWEALRDSARKTWRPVRKRIGVGARIKRVSARYINRLDIPRPSEDSVDFGDYVKIKAVEPPDLGLGRKKAFFWQFDYNWDDSRYLVLIRIGTVNPVLINYDSIMFDVDVLRVTDLPQKENLIWLEFDYLRKLKNHIFESSVTDRARALFIERKPRGRTN